MFGMSNLSDLPDLPKYKLDENRQIVIDEIIEEKQRLLYRASKKKNKKMMGQLSKVCLKEGMKINEVK